MDDLTLQSFENELDFFRNQSVMEEDIHHAMFGDSQNQTTHAGHLLQERGQHTGGGDHQLRAQLTLLTKERDSLHVLWQTSQKTIYALENELKTYHQSYGVKEYQQNANENRREMELKLETSLSDYVELETKYKAVQAKLSTAEQEMKSKDKETRALVEKTTHLETKIEELTKDLEELRINFGSEKKNNEDLKNHLSLCQKDIAVRVKKEAEAKSKVAEALQLFDIVSAQKNEAYKKIGEITGELAQVKQALASAKRTAESAYKAELDELRNMYNEKITDMLAHIRNLDSELVEKGLLLNKAMREIKVLKQENDDYLTQQKECLKAADPKLEIAEKRMETMFQELVSSERRNMQLVCEKQCLAIEMQRVQETHAREIKRRDWEEGLLKTQCEELKLQVEHLQKSLEETHQMVNKLQNMLTSRSELNQRIVSTKEEELTELNKHLGNQMELSRKWKESYVEMTEKLKRKLEELQKENTELRARLRPPYSESSSD